MATMRLAYYWVLYINYDCMHWDNNNGPFNVHMVLIFYGNIEGSSNIFRVWSELSYIWGLNDALGTLRHENTIMYRTTDVLLVIMPDTVHLYECHYNNVIMGKMATQITNLTIVYSTVYSGADQRKHQSSASLTFVRGIHREPVNSPHKWPVTRKMLPFDDVIM